MNVHHNVNTTSEATPESSSVHPATPTYGPTDAQKLRHVADQLFANTRPASMPMDIWDAPFDLRHEIRRALLELADDIDSAPGPVEIELVLPAVSPYSLEASREIFYLVRVALT